MLDLKTVITTKNLEHYMNHQEEEVIETLKSIMLDIKERSEDRKLNEKNFNMLKPETIRVSYSFIKSVLSKYGYRVGHRIAGCIDAAINLLPDEKTKFASLFHEDFSEIKETDEYMKKRLNELKSKLPTGTHTVYPTK